MADDKAITIDPTRLIQGIVIGIEFLGAGAIMSPSDNGRLKGVRSGAAIWTVGSISIACGLGFLKEGAFISALIFVVLNIFDWLHIRADKQGNYLVEQIQLPFHQAVALRIAVRHRSGEAGRVREDRADVRCRAGSVSGQ